MDIATYELDLEGHGINKPGKEGEGKGGLKKGTCSMYTGAFVRNEKVQNKIGGHQ